MLRQETFTNIALYLRDEEGLVHASEYTAKILPSAVYHLVTVIPRIRSRSLYTKLYMDTLQELIKDLEKIAEMELLRRNILVIKKSTHNSLSELWKYIEKNNIDLLVLPRTVDIEDISRIDKITRKIITDSPIPLLLYPSIVKPDTLLDKNLVCIGTPLELNRMMNMINMAKEIMQRKHEEMNILFLTSKGIARRHKFNIKAFEAEMSLLLSVCRDMYGIHNLYPDPHEDIKELYEFSKLCSLMMIDKEFLDLLTPKNTIRKNSKKFNIIALLSTETALLIVPQV